MQDETVQKYLAAIALLFDLKLFHLSGELQRILDCHGIEVLVERDRLNYYRIPEVPDSVTQDDVKRLLAERDGARKEKRWQDADRIRSLIQDKGWKVLDRPDGAIAVHFTGATVRIRSLIQDKVWKVLDRPDGAIE